MNRRGDGFIPFLLEIVRSTVGECSFTEQHAEQVTQQIIANYGGAPVYVPKIDPARRERVLKKFNGRNRNEVMAEEGISKSQFYEILKGG